MKISRSLAIVILVSIAVAANADNAMDRAISQARVLIERMKVFDSEGMAPLFNTKMFERAGANPAGWQQLIASEYETLKSNGAVTNKFELLPSGRLFAGDGQLYVMLPYSRVLEIQGHHMHIEAYFIGGSVDGGTTWKFIDGRIADQENIRKFIPSYDGSPLPTNRLKSLP
jgi:hypothetical protein